MDFEGWAVAALGIALALAVLLLIVKVSVGSSSSATRPSAPQSPSRDVSTPPPLPRPWEWSENAKQTSAPSAPSSRPTEDVGRPGVQSIVDAAQGLPAASDADIDAGFSAIVNTWGAAEVLKLTADDLRWTVIETLCGDVGQGFILRKIDRFEARGGAVVLQFNTISESPPTFRPCRIAKRQDGTFALYGHKAMYQYRDTYLTSDYYVASLDPLVQELLVIGVDGEYLIRDDAGGARDSPRAREIGTHLDRSGGMALMAAAHSIVSDKLGRSVARELEVAWDGIGSWQR